MTKLAVKYTGTNSTERLSAREIAIVRYIWVLSPAEQARLDLYTRRNYSLAELSDMLEASQGKIILSPHYFHPIIMEKQEVMECAVSAVVSFRAQFASTLFVALIKGVYS